MLIEKVDTKYKFKSYFNTNNGSYMRTGILDKSGKDTGEDPFMTSFPELIDIGIMGHCIHGLSGKCKESGIQCYQHGDISRKANMAFEDYRKIIDECSGKTFQVALGGCGDPDQHEAFAEILKYTRESNIVPNFTTSGFGLTPEKVKLCKQYCGAVAVSMYSRIDKEIYLYREIDINNEGTRKYTDKSDIPVIFDLGLEELSDVKYQSLNNISIGNKLYRPISSEEIIYNQDINREYIRLYRETLNPNYTMKSIKLLLNEGVTTNIHFVISNSTIDEAILRLKYSGFPKGINAVIFLLSKPVGLGTELETLKIGDERLQEFFKLIDNNNFDFKIGFDSCTIPGILNLCKSINLDTVDTCEAARWSMYITPDMYALPCSFDNQKMGYAVKLDKDCKNAIKIAWDSCKFEAVRRKFKDRCAGCNKQKQCLGGCPLIDSIILCNNKHTINGVDR